MLRLAGTFRLAKFLLRACLLFTLWSNVSCRNSLIGGRKVLELTASSMSQNNVELMLTIPSFVCQIVTEERDSSYCFGVLLSSRWLLTASSCALKVKSISDKHVPIICRSPTSSTAHNQNEFDVVEVHPLMRAATGERQGPDIALLKLNTDAPGPYVTLEESDGPDLYILEQKEVMDTFLKGLDMEEVQTQNTWRNPNIDLVGLPLVKKPSTIKNRDSSENPWHQIRTCCRQTACRLYSDGVKRCTFSRITPLEHNSICRTTGSCNEVPAVSNMTPSFLRSLSATTEEDACLDSPRPVPLAERRLLPPFASPPLCSNDIKAELQSLSSKQLMFRMKRLVDSDNATSVNESIKCSGFDVNTLDTHNETLLHDAAWHNSNRSAKVLCVLQIDTEVKNKQGKTALLVAANRTSFETLKVILNYTKDVNAADNKGRTALHFAAFQNSSRIAKVLCEEEQLNLEARDENGRTALIFAAKLGSLDALKVIASHNVSVNAQDNRKRTALYYSVKNCHASIAEFLVRKKADPSIKDDKGKTPVDLISKSSNGCDQNTMEKLHAILSSSEMKE